METAYRRIVNVNFTVCGLHMDAAIDCDWQLHCYDEIERDKYVPVELYCFDKPEWDINLFFQEKRNAQQGDIRSFLHTQVDFDDVIKQARKWVRRMKREEQKGGLR